MDTWFIILYLNVQRMPLRVKRKRQDLKQKKICRSIWKKFGRKLKKKKREICKDKQILMISRFYKPAFVTIIFLRTYYKRKGRGNARKKLKQLVSLRHCVFPIMTEKRQSMQKKRLYKSMRSIKHSWKRVVQSTKFGCLTR